MRLVVRVIAVVTVAVIGISVGGVPAWGKGGAPLHFDRRYYVPGETAHGSTSFGKGSVGLHMMDRGPFYAFLLPGDAFIDPPHIPQGAIRLGRIHIAPIEHGTYRASLAFTVPDAANGWHTVGYCNDPCTVAQVGELWGGWFQVFASHDEARTQMRIDHLRERLSQIRTNHRQLKQRLADRRETQERTLLYARRSNAELADRVERLDRELGAVRDEARRSPWLAIAGWAVFGVLLLTNLGYAAARMRRRRSRPKMPPEPSVVEARPERELEPVP